MKSLFSWLSLFLLCAGLAGIATAQGEKPGAPPTPPGMSRDAGSGPSKAFQLRSAQKDSVGFSLSAGWNLISLPLEPYNTQIDSVLASIAGSYDQVWAYDGCDGVNPWRFYDPADAAASDLTTLDHRYGFWIHLTEDATLTIDGDPPANTDTPICAGWNLLGYPRNAPLPVTGALVSIVDAVDRVFGFVPSVGSSWRFWGSLAPAWVNDLDAMAPGHGYWVLANADGTFTSVAPEPPPVISSLDLLEGQEITAPTPINATIDTTAQVSWTLAHRPEGESTWFEFASGETPIVNAQLDPTLLLNGIYEIRLEVRDVFGQSTSADGNVIVDGAMKPGVVTLSYPDMVVPMAGLPITVIRTYDSRDKGQGDFGYGWRLELAKGTYRNNRPPGEGWNITLSETVGQPPCSSAVEFLTHFTDIRLGDQGFFRFALAVDAFGYASQVNGGCSGEAHFVQTGGRPGATLHILGNTEVFSGGLTTDLVDASTFELYEPQNVLLTTPEGIEYVLNLEDGVRQISEPNGATVTFADNGIHHSDGRSIFFERDAEGRIRYLIDPAGQTVSYTYDSAGDLVAVTDLLAETTRYEYLAGIPHHLTNILDNDGQVSHTFDYDEGGRLAFTCPGGGDCAEMQHDVDGRSEVVYDSTGRATTYTYDDYGNVLTQTDSLGNTTSVTYDDFGRMTSITDALGGVTTYGYDERGNLITTTKPHDPAEPSANYTITRTYDNQDRVTAIDLPTGGGYRFTYAGGDREAEITDHEGNVIVALGYDGTGRNISETGPFGTISHVLDSAGNAVQTTDVFGRQAQMTFNSLSQLTSMVDVHGRLSTYEHDPAGRETHADYGNNMVFDFDYNDTKGQVWTHADGPTTGPIDRMIDDQGRLSGWRMPSGAEVHFERDPSGRLLVQQDPMGGELTYSYDGAGRLGSRTDARGATTSVVRDALGRVVDAVDALGNSSELTYGVDGRIANQTDALGRTFSFSSTPTETVTTDPLGRESRILYSPLGLPETWIYPDGSQISAEYLLGSTLLKAEEFPVSATNEAGAQRQLAYDNFGRLVSVADELGATTTFSYGEELLLSVTGPTGEIRSFTYDQLGNVATITTEDGGTSSHIYGDDNRLASRIQPSGATWQYSYDSGGRLTSQLSSNGEHVQLDYNLGDQIVSMQDPTGTTNYSYDLGGLLSTIDFPDGSSIAYQRDLLGRITSQTVSSPSVASLTTTYTYDAVGNLLYVTDPLGGQTSWTYDSVNRPTTRVLPNGITTEWTYDLRDRVLSVVHRNESGIVLASATYERDILGQPTQITWQDGTWVEVAYDNARRVTAERFFQAGGLLEEELLYGYDPAGNRVSRSDAQGAHTYTYADGHRLTEVSGPSPESYSYDLDGRLASRTRDGSTQNLFFDTADRLVSVTQDGLTIADYAHDGQRRRVVASSGQRRFLVAPSSDDNLQHTHLVTDNFGSLAAAYVWAGDETLMRFGPSGTSYYLTDAMGSVIALANDTGELTAQFRYDGFGNERLAEGAEATPPAAVEGDFRFHGQWLEGSTGIYHFRARDYDPRTGLFLSRDPAEPITTRPETFHPYRFADANAYAYSDSSGLFTLIEINISINQISSTSAIKAALAQQIRRMATEAVGQITSELLYKAIGSIAKSFFPTDSVPFMDIIERRRSGLNNSQRGKFFEDLVTDLICGFLGDNSIADHIFLEVPINGTTGEAITNGQNCARQENDRQDFIGRRINPALTPSNPDFLLSPVHPTNQRAYRKKSWIIGDFKRSASSVGGNIPQTRAIVNHARHYVYGSGILFVAWRPGNPSGGDLAAARAAGRFAGTFPFIITIKHRN